MAATTPAITGTTRLFAVIGDPVEQVRSPAMLNPILARLGVDAVLIPVHAPVAHLAEVVRGLQRTANLDGLLVTVPHKFAVCAFADRLSPTVEATGSANALRREPDGGWFAENFDGVGFVRGLERAGHPPAGRHVSLMGAGGAGSALALALLDAGVSRLSVYDPDADRLQALIFRMTDHGAGRVDAQAAPRLHDADIAVNATPLGLRPEDPMPFDPDGLPPGAVVADIIMKPSVTPLLAAAAALGHPAHPGAPMLECQMDLYRDFFGLPADRAGEVGSKRGSTPLPAPEPRAR
jgi:shikimate dehydrogenase